MCVGGPLSSVFSCQHVSPLLICIGCFAVLQHSTTSPLLCVCVVYLSTPPPPPPPLPATNSSGMPRSPDTRSAGPANTAPRRTTTEDESMVTYKKGRASPVMSPLNRSAPIFFISGHRLCAREHVGDERAQAHATEETAYGEDYTYFHMQIHRYKYIHIYIHIYIYIYTHTSIDVCM